jgi:hypothetical protein
LSDEHEAGVARFLTPARAARWRATPGRAPRDLPHFERRLDPARAQRLRMTTQHGPFVARVLALLRAEGAPETCVLFTDDGRWGEAAPFASAIPDLMWAGAGFASCVAGRLGLYVSEDGSHVFVLRA